MSAKNWRIEKPTKEAVKEKLLDAYNICKEIFGTSNYSSPNNPTYYERVNDALDSIGQAINATETPHTLRTTLVKKVSEAINENRFLTCEMDEIVRCVSGKEGKIRILTIIDDPQKLLEEALNIAKGEEKDKPTPAHSR